jgi:hypothetical protein
MTQPLREIPFYQKFTLSGRRRQVYYRVPGVDRVDGLATRPVNSLPGDRVVIWLPETTQVETAK